MKLLDTVFLSYDRVSIAMRQAFSKRFWQHSWRVMLAMVSCCLIVWVTPVLASGGMPSQSHLESADALDSGQLDAGIDRSDSPLAQGSALFAAGRLAAAADVWQRAAENYGVHGNRLDQAKALHYLALAYFNLGQWELAQQANTESQTQLEAISAPPLLGAILNLHGQLQLVLGKPEQGIDTWQQAAATYASVGDTTGQLGAQLNQAKALQTLGHYQQSQRLLKQSVAIAQTQSEPAVKATSLKLLGMALQAVGDLERSQALLTESLIITQQLATNTPVYADQASATLVSLGNTMAARGETTAALANYQQAAG